MRQGRSAGPGRTEIAERVRCQSLNAADGRKFDSRGDAERLSLKLRIERFGVPRPSFLLFEPLARLPSPLRGGPTRAQRERGGGVGATPPDAGANTPTRLGLRPSPPSPQGGGRRRASSASRRGAGGGGLAMGQRTEWVRGGGGGKA